MKKIVKTLLAITMLTLVLMLFTGCIDIQDIKCKISGHTLVTREAIDPTCTEAGFSSEVVCDVCGYVEQAKEEIAPLGHTMLDIDEVAPTCTQDGCSGYSRCSVCGAEEGKEVLPAGHSFGEKNENGTATCQNCNITLVSTAAGLQAALDNAVNGTTIQLHEGVNYGIVYLRPSANENVTKTVDWVGNNYRYETYSLFENITIIGAKGATVDAIKIEGGTYYNTEHSQMDKYPVMLSLIELKNFVIDGVTFTGKGGYDPQGYGNAINLSGGNIKVDGLTLKNCVLEDPDNNARLIYKTESTTNVHKYVYGEKEFTFSPSLKDITITGCTLNGGYIGIELRETENITITNNEFNVADRNILLPTNTGCTYTGTVTITGNVSNNAKERFVRASEIGNAVLIIKDNVINSYAGADLDYIKATGVTGEYTVENNAVTDGTGENRELTVVVQ